MKVWSVCGWDELPRGIFSSGEAARQFAESQSDFEVRELAEDGTGYDCYPFIDEYEVDQVKYG